MEDLLKKIKETERQANTIIEEAEREARKIIENTRIEANKSLNNEKTKIFKEYATLKDNKTESAKKEKDKKIKEKIDNFYKIIGDKEIKKAKAIELVLSKIREQL